MLHLSDVYVHYDRLAAVQGLSLDVRPGEIVGLIGHNGAGKSTTILTIAGVLKPTSGDVYFDGDRITALAPEEIIRRGISTVPESRHIFARLSVRENLIAGATVRGLRRRELRQEIDDTLDRFPALRKYIDSNAGLLSGGEQQQLAIARALLSRPRLLLLDEPSLGLAPMIIDVVFDMIVSLREAGVTILIVEQNAAKTAEVADRVYLLRAGGRVEFEARAEELRNRPDFEAAYLGFHD
jgi:branched-chain amino acid transport system ATP-binding protein